jgi:hypothetical protein
LALKALSTRRFTAAFYFSVDLTSVRTRTLRIEGYVANLLDEDASNKAQFAPGLNLRFLNDPHTMGLRVRYRLRNRAGSQGHKPGIGLPRPGHPKAGA